MAAQKLTKARLAQILLILTVLVIAFIWRTLKYESLQMLDCSQNRPCELTISQEKLEIKRENDGIRIQLPKNGTLKIDLNQKQYSITRDDESILLSVQTYPVTFYIRDKDITIAKVIYR
ncbi:hypothetical protein BOO24_07515 [Vibrio navarrensis]|uniref:hypothetical protein n=1 Tax=Vibrio navarrensis TaxID=29495 RepID=UPI00186A8437|nr:hypothetical protein [Vibrio navarrensis]MBE3667786.1 hypothetical protein [Vibrio navarrensis]MBE4592217.1 hypothetical protein [Vibrio navarrensis]